MRSVCAFAMAFVLSATLFAAEPRPNIILVMTDDQGYGEIGRHGNPILKTPRLDAFAEESVRFTDFLVSPTCAPTRAALLTGRHEFRSGVTHTIFERERLAPSAVTLPELLKKAGYATGIFGKWHLGDEPEYHPSRRGFEETFIHGGGGIGQTYPGSCGDAPGNTYFDPAILHNGVFVKTTGFCTDVFFDEAIRWIEDRRSGDRPFFAYITPNAPHSPYDCPDEWTRPFASHGPDAAGYYGMIANIDFNFGRLLDRLAEWQIDKNTLVIFMTDNGHPLAGLYNAGMKAAKGSPYLGGVRVPAFWRWPGRFSPRDEDRLAAHVDILPTLVELAGADVPDNAKLDGRSLAPLLAANDSQSTEWPDRFLFTHVGRWKSGRAAEAKFANCAVRSKRFHLVNNRELYDLESDPSELTNVIGQHPEQVSSMRAAYAAWWSEVSQSLVNEDALGPKVNPFKELYWKQFGGGPDAALLEQMDPQRKFE